MSENTIKYAQLVDLASLQTLMDDLHQVIGIANAIIDTDGIVITNAGWQDACLKFHRVNHDTCSNCIESDTALAESMLHGDTFAIYKCLNGLVDSAMPIIVDGQHVANIFTGQCFIEPPDLEFFRGRARRCGFEENSYLQSIAKVPVIPRQRLETITKMYAQLAQSFAKHGADRLKQKQAVAELAALNNELNRRVEERAEQLIQNNQQLLFEKRALAASEARLSALFKNMSSGVAVYRVSEDGRDFIIIGFNKAAEQIEKITRKQLIGKKLTEMFPGVFEFGLLDVLRRVAKTGAPEAFPPAFYRDERIQGWRENYVYKLPGGEIVSIYNDVTERKHAEKALHLTQFSVDRATECLYWIAADAKLQFVNNTACQVLGYSREELLAFSVTDIDPSLQAEHWSVHWQELKQKGSLKLETLHRCKDGREIPVEVAANYLVFEGLEYNCAFVRDISERKALQAELERQARIDYLTGIANRRYFMEQGEAELARSGRYGNPLSVLMLDIDYFKAVNDNYGHAAGDHALQKLGCILVEVLREIDIPGRMGGEEFAILLPETGLLKAIEVAERLRTVVAGSAIIVESGQALYFTVSIGVATLTDEGSSIGDLLNLADKGLYQAKHGGRNKVCSFSQ
ncbi:diguanylate cyclase [Methylomonas albis]|uniref:diguanylate cyclase n=1 Tax=Methylomonas albis TaxID=1854563 RepID=A0ABR9D4E3_9GAMM|nr:diguanylate cyclase [Methylomonas albis]MBD9357945.1 diguanylate cyclase [Methylomonas albis]